MLSLARTLVAALVVLVVAAGSGVQAQSCTGFGSGPGGVDDHTDCCDPATSDGQSGCTGTSAPNLQHLNLPTACTAQTCPHSATNCARVCPQTCAALLAEAGTCVEIMGGLSTPTGGLAQCCPSQGCPPGAYDDDGDVSTACQACPAGYVTDALSDSGAVACTACVAGRQSAASTVACAACVAGQYAAEAGSSSCVACPPGSLSEGGAGSLGDCLCQSGVCPSPFETGAPAYLVSCGYETPAGASVLSQPDATRCVDASPPALTCTAGTVVVDWDLAPSSWGTGWPVALADLLTLDDNSARVGDDQADLCILVQEAGKVGGSCREAAAISVPADADACGAVTAPDSASVCEALLTASSSDAGDTRACVYTRVLTPGGGLAVPIGSSGTVSLSHAVVFDALPARADRTITITATDAEANSADCDVTLHVLAPKPVASHSIIDMLALTTSATQEYQIQIENVGDSVLKINTADVSVLGDAGDQWAAVKFQARNS